jgi:hypothetical protein
MRPSFCIFSAELHTSDYSDLNVIINQLSTFIINVKDKSRGEYDTLLTDLHLAIYDLKNAAYTRHCASQTANSFNLNIAYFKIEFLINSFSNPAHRINLHDFKLLIDAHNNLLSLINSLYQRSHDCN